MTDTARIALRVIKMRRWKNGQLQLLCDKGLDGTLEAEDTACNEHEWEEACSEDD